GARARRRRPVRIVARASATAWRYLMAPVSSKSATGARAGLRVPLFVKFLIGNLTLAALLITGGYLVVRSQARLKDRGNYLDKHFKRFAGYLEGLSRALSSAGKIVADNDEIVNPLVIAAQTAAATPE